MQFSPQIQLGAVRILPTKSKKCPITIYKDNENNYITRNAATIARIQHQLEKKKPLTIKLTSASFRLCFSAQSFAAVMS